MYTHGLQTSSNKKDIEKYKSLFPENQTTVKGPIKSTGFNANISRKQRRAHFAQKRIATQRKSNERFIKNLSNLQLTDNQVNMISKGLKFVPTPVTDEKNIKRQLLQDFEKFARRMRLQYIFHTKNTEPHPFHVKSDWVPPVQKSVALESYLESVKIQLAEIKPYGVQSPPKIVGWR